MNWELYFREKTASGRTSRMIAAAIEAARAYNYVIIVFMRPIEMRKHAETIARITDGKLTMGEMAADIYLQKHGKIHLTTRVVSHLDILAPAIRGFHGEIGKNLFIDHHIFESALIRALMAMTQFDGAEYTASCRAEDVLRPEFLNTITNPPHAIEIVQPVRKLAKKRKTKKK